MQWSLACGHNSINFSERIAAQTRTEGFNELVAALKRTIEQLTTDVKNADGRTERAQAHMATAEQAHQDALMALRAEVTSRRQISYEMLVFPKLNAYHLFIHAGVVSQGLLQYLSATCPRLVWASFGSWLRTNRSGIAPSEFVVATALGHSLPEFLLNTTQTNILAKFIVDRQDPARLDVFRVDTG